MISYQYMMIGFLFYAFSHLALEGSDLDAEEHEGNNSPYSCLSEIPSLTLPLTLQKAPLEGTLPIPWWTRMKSKLFSQLGYPFDPHPDWITTEDLLKSQQLFLSFNSSLAISQTQAQTIRNTTIHLIAEHLATNKAIEEKADQLATCPDELLAIYKSVIQDIILKFDAKKVTDDDALAAAKFFLNGNTDVPDWIICFQGKKLDALINAPELKAYYQQCALEKQKLRAAQIFTQTLFPMLLEVEYLTLLKTRLGFNEAKALKIFFCLKHQESIKNPEIDKGCYLLFIRHNTLMGLMPLVSGITLMEDRFRPH